MGRQGDPNTIKRGDASRKGDNEKTGDRVGVPHKPSYDTRFESREGIFSDIMGALQDDGNDSSRVALYGVGGAGKTTLAKQVAKKAMELNMFNLVVFVTVGYPIYVNKIQRELADGLGIMSGEEDDRYTRKRQISARLSRCERVLIILDDLWQRLDLEEIGISNAGTHKGCKVLVTTRSREVGYLMDCKHSFHLFLLTEDEAWSLFRTHAGMDDGYASPDLILITKEVAKHCQGLPLAISVIGSALGGGKTLVEWMQVLHVLRRSQGEFQHFIHFIHYVVRLSYNGLSSKLAKTIFLTCGLFPKNHEIVIEDLSQCAIRLGLCGSKNEVSRAIESLKDSSLLHHSKDHDVFIRCLFLDVARSILREENPAYRDSIDEYIDALRHEIDFQWREELDRLLGLLYGVRKHPSSSSTSNATFNGGDQGRQLQIIMESYSYTQVAAAIPKPSRKLVDFYGLCQVDRSFLPLLKEACAMNPRLKESQRKQSEFFRQSAFDCLGRVLFLLHNVRKRDWVHLKHELHVFWEQAKLMKFDLEWLSPTVEEVFSSAEIARIEALQEEENYLNQEAAKLRERLKIVENKAAVFRTEITLIESKLDDFAITPVSKAQVVSKVTPWRKKILFRK